MKKISLNLSASLAANPACNPTTALQAPNRLGFYKVKDEKWEIRAYGMHLTYTQGYEVEVTHDRATQLLVNLEPGLTLYISTETFLNCCAR